MIGHGDGLLYCSDGGIPDNGFCAFKRGELAIEAYHGNLESFQIGVYIFQDSPVQRQDGEGKHPEYGNWYTSENSIHFVIANSRIFR